MVNRIIKIVALLLLLLHAFSISADVTIDCGGSKFFIENSISWDGDNDLIGNGESMTVGSKHDTLPRAMTTLRVFRTRKKNCYTILGDKGDKYMVRASFYYGNYDGRSSPPTFALLFDGNFWTTVVTSTRRIVYHEAVYVAKGNGTSVCVAQTSPNMFPFISALEVRDLPSTMYKHVDPDHALFLTTRVAFGSSEVVRYPDDEYDRMWRPARNLGGLIAVSSNATSLSSIDLDDNPPGTVFENAVMPSSTLSSISLTVNNLPSTPVPVYVNMYFSEVSDEVDSTTERRSFRIYVNNVPTLGSPIIPPFEDAVQVYISNLSASSKTSFGIRATSGSTLPPLINAAEVFTITDKLSEVTSGDDVEGLEELQSSFSRLHKWSGDPCLPSSYKWEWVNCSRSASPRITALYLSGFNLSGSLPDFSSMDALQIIDLRNNSLDGPIPEFLGTLPNVRELNLADNDFEGPVPKSLSQNSRLKLMVTGNPNVCTSGSGSGRSCRTTTSSKNKLGVIVGAAVSGLLVFWVIVGVVAILLHKKKKSAAVASGPTSGPSKAGMNGTEGNVMGLQMSPAPASELQVNNERPLEEANLIPMGHHSQRTTT